MMETPEPSTSRKELFPVPSTSGASDEQPSASETPDQGSSEDAGSRTSSGLRHALEGLNVNASGSVLQEAEMYFLQKENQELKAKLAHLSTTFSFEHIKDDAQLINMYTGIPNVHLFQTLFALFEHRELTYCLGWTVGIIPKRGQLLITLMKLRINLLQLDLACRFNCSTTTIANIVSTWIHALHETLFCQLMKEIPSRQKNRLCLPGCFSVFSNCRIVLDCTEVKYIKPKSLATQKMTYSAYKRQNTVKGLVGVAPNGVITFVRELYPGSTSDKKIVADCGILGKLQVGDMILADKGFLIKDILPAGVDLNLPPFLTTAQFTPEQAVQTRTIARARIHVERAIRRIKCWKILQATPSNLTAQATTLFQVCSALCNFQFPLIAEVEDLYGSSVHD
ncbi:hypothetical protein Zmor_006058 [Zophobas morio]|uniref:DDE Tnp4 domain-containing protein n=2 Tax=Zophobas morio TaxID=2755281 RepID=A0AA38MMJ6_9CUCU|nr:hypothetical protein Zmor_006058 [Zophobas morio]